MRLIKCRVVLAALAAVCPTSTAMVARVFPATRKSRGLLFSVERSRHALPPSGAASPESHPFDHDAERKAGWFRALAAMVGEVQCRERSGK